MKDKLDVCFHVKKMLLKLLNDLKTVVHNLLHVFCHLIDGSHFI